MKKPDTKYLNTTFRQKKMEKFVLLPSAIVSLSVVVKFKIKQNIRLFHN